MVRDLAAVVVVFRHKSKYLDALRELSVVIAIASRCVLLYEI